MSILHTFFAADSDDHESPYGDIDETASRCGKEEDQMEVAYNVISILMTGVSLVVLLYGAWLSVRFCHDAYEGIGTHAQDPASHAASQQKYPIQHRSTSCSNQVA